MKDGRSFTKGRRMWSTSPEIRSVGQRLALAMGRPGGGLVSLRILGSKYSCGVLGLSKTKKLATLGDRAPHSSSSSISLRICVLWLLVVSDANCR